MGKRYDRHSDMCGCERCAAAYESENPQPVFDVVEDPDICDYCGSELMYCTCADDDGQYDDDWDE